MTSTPEVTSSEPGTCPKCGVKLVAAAPTTFVCPMHPDVASDTAMRPGGATVSHCPR